MSPIYVSYGCFLKWGSPKSPWASILKWSHFPICFPYFPIDTPIIVGMGYQFFYIFLHVYVFLYFPIDTPIIVGIGHLFFYRYPHFSYMFSYIFLQMPPCFPMFFFPNLSPRLQDSKTPRLQGPGQDGQHCTAPLGQGRLQWVCAGPGCQAVHGDFHWGDLWICSDICIYIYIHIDGWEDGWIDR